MRKYTITAAIIFVITISLAVMFPYVQRMTYPIDPSVIAAGNGVGFRLLKVLDGSKADKNVLISPTGVAAALDMVCNGAHGHTRNTMMKALGLQGISLERVNHESAALTWALQHADRQVKLSIANSLWVMDDSPFKPEFTDCLRRFYDADANNINFGDPQVPAYTINQWADRQTDRKIGMIVDRLPDKTAVVSILVNATCFNAKWTKAFTDGDTRDHHFITLSSETETVPLMHQGGRYRYYHGDGVQAISLPYGSGRMSMYVILPDNVLGLPALIATIDLNRWKHWISRMRETPGGISLPEFKLEYGTRLNDALSGLGMGVAFDRDRADFTDMTDGRRVWIDRAEHKTVMDVNERGTQASAATASLIMKGPVNLPMPGGFDMVVDHPFLCAIVDNQTGAIIFLGAITDPRA